MAALEERRQGGRVLTRYVPVGADQGVFFDFVTVRNAGHMAPRYKPAATFHMMQSFLLSGERHAVGRPQRQ